MSVEKEDLQAVSPIALAPAQIEAKAEAIGVGKTQIETPRLVALSILAGLFIGSGALFMTLVKSDSSLSFATSSVLGGLCFSLGLIAVIVAGAELFTGNSLMVMALFSKKIGVGRYAEELGYRLARQLGRLARSGMRRGLRRHGDAQRRGFRPGHDDGGRRQDQPRLGHHLLPRHRL
jgi:hypothetical protein